MPFGRLRINSDMPALQDPPAAGAQVGNPFGKFPPSLKLWRAGRAGSAPPV